jgi:hypothetical protein
VVATEVPLRSEGIERREIGMDCDLTGMSFEAAFQKWGRA